MKYTVVKTDGRHTYHKHFDYYIKFCHSMNMDQGPLMFNKALKWFVANYNWSAEIRQYMEMFRWSSKSIPMMRVPGGFVRPMPKDLPEECNQLWSWSNGIDDLRIYVKSDKELMFFTLAHPIEK